MGEISFHQIEKFLADTSENLLPQVWMLFGEPALYKPVLEQIKVKVFPKKKKDYNTESFEDNDTNFFLALESVKTKSLFSGPKMVIISNAKLFLSKKSDLQLFEKAKEAYSTDIKKAAGFLLNLLAVRELTLDDFIEQAPEKVLNLTSLIAEDTEWLTDTLVHIKTNNLSIPKLDDAAAILQNRLEKGVRKNHYLIITTEIIDKRKSIYKKLKEKGQVVDCSIPKGDRAKDKREQETIIKKSLHGLLVHAHKKIDPPAFQALIQKTGMDLSIIINDIKKLIDYVGERSNITTVDVETLLTRVKKDPIYELTKALAARNLSKVLFFSNSLLSENFHPLQIIAAMVNQIRKLLMTKRFLESTPGKAFYPGMSFPEFSTQIVPLIVNFDQQLMARLQSWESQLKPDAKSKKMLKKDQSDLIIAKNPKSPYPIYFLCKDAQQFTLDELKKAILVLNQADITLKSSPIQPKIIIENAIFKILGAVGKS